MICCSVKIVDYRSPAADEKVGGVDDSVASVSDSMMDSGDVTVDSIKEHAKYTFEKVFA